MKTIGLIGGMSWESSAIYYRLLNEGVRARAGGFASANVLMRSVDFAPIVEMQRAGDWKAAGALLADAAKRLEAGGADCVLICTNTMHIVADMVASAVSLPLIDIINVTSAGLKAAEKSKPLLLATRYTMEHGFYQARMAERGVDCVTPDKADRDVIHDIIYSELCQGVVREESRERAHEIIAAAARDKGADSVVLGCTEIVMLVEPDDAPLPAFDSTALHAAAALDFAFWSGGVLRRSAVSAKSA